MDWDSDAMDKVCSEFGRRCAVRVANAVRSGTQGKVTATTDQDGVQLGGDWLKAEYGDAETAPEPFTMRALSDVAIGADLGDHR